MEYAYTAFFQDDSGMNGNGFMELLADCNVNTPIGAIGNGGYYLSFPVLLEIVSE